MTDARSNVVSLPAVRSRRWTSFVAAPRRVAQSADSRKKATRTTKFRSNTTDILSWSTCRTKTVKGRRVLRSTESRDNGQSHNAAGNRQRQRPPANRYTRRYD